MTILFTLADEISGGTEQQVNDYLLFTMANIDYTIKAAALGDAFSCSIEVERYMSNGRAPNLIFQIVSILRDRGFHVTYDGSFQSNVGLSGGDILVDHTGSRIITTPFVGNLKIEWAHPNMNQLEASQVRFPSRSKISGLGHDFRAGTLYLYQTEGVDLRQYSSTICARDIEREIRRVAMLGGNIFTYTGPSNVFYRVPNDTLTSLYGELLDALNYAGYDVEFEGSALVIMWNSFRALAFDGAGSSVDLTLTVLPSPPEEYAYVHTQTTPSTLWTIDHNLGFIPSVELTNSFGIEFEAEVINVTVNRTIVQMNVPLSGFARLT